MVEFTLHGYNGRHLKASGLLDGVNEGDYSITSETVFDGQMQKRVTEITLDIEPTSLDTFADHFINDAQPSTGHNGVPIYFWDKDGDLGTPADTYVVVINDTVEGYRRDLTRYAERFAAEHPELAHVHENKPDLKYFGYYPLLTREDSGECMEYVPPEKDGEVQQYTYRGIQSFQVPEGYRIPTTNELAEFTRKNPQAVIRVARAQSGERADLPVVAKLKITNHVYPATEEGLTPFDFVWSSDEELAQVGAWLDARLDKATGKEIAFQLTTTGEKKLVLRYPPEALTAKIDELKEALSKDGDGPVKLLDETVLSRNTARNLLKALTKARDGKNWWEKMASAPGSGVQLLKDNWPLGLLVASPIIMWKMLRQGRELQRENLDFQAENFIFDEEKRQAYFAKRQGREFQALLRRSRWYHRPGRWLNGLRLLPERLRNISSSGRLPPDSATADLLSLNKTLRNKYGLGPFDDVFKRPKGEWTGLVLEEIPEKLYRAIADKAGIPDSYFEAFKEGLRRQLTVERWPGIPKFYEFLIELSHDKGIQSDWVREIVARHVASMEEELRGSGLSEETRIVRQAELGYFRSLLTRNKAVPGMMALDAAMIYGSVPEKTESNVHAVVGGGFVAHMLLTNPANLPLLLPAAAGASVTHAVTKPVVNDLPLDKRGRRLAQSILDIFGGIGGYAGGAWGLSRLGRRFPQVAALQRAGLGLGGAPMTALASSAALIAAPVLPFLAAGEESKENASLQSKSVKEQLALVGVDVDHYQQAFIEPIEGTTFRGISEYNAQDFERLLLDLFQISVTYKEEGEKEAMSRLKDFFYRHYMREYSNFRGWQDVHRTDLIVLLLRWTSLLEPELAMPIQQDYPILSSLMVPGDEPSAAVTPKKLPQSLPEPLSANSPQSSLRPPLGLVAANDLSDSLSDSLSDQDNAESEEDLDAPGEAVGTSSTIFGYSANSAIYGGYSANSAIYTGGIGVFSPVSSMARVALIR